MHIIFDLSLALIGVSAFCLLIVFSELVFDFVYKHSRLFAKRWDKFCESLPEWNDEDEDEVY